MKYRLAEELQEVELLRGELLPDNRGDRADPLDGHGCEIDRAAGRGFADRACRRTRLEKSERIE